jgi:hypothetical protein
MPTQNAALQSSDARTTASTQTTTKTSATRTTKKPWCRLEPVTSLAFHGTYLMSTSMFYLPNYTKSNVAGSQDVTHHKQQAFLHGVQHWERLLESSSFFRRELGVRLYYDDSIFKYVTEKGGKPWPAVIDRLSKNTSFQLVKYSCQLPQLCRENDMHRGLFGTFIRIHAACRVPGGFFTADSTNNRPRLVAVIDLDNVYSAEWFRRHIEFLRDPKGSVMGFTGVFELNLHAYLPAADYPGGLNCPPNLKFGMTSFKRPLPAACWNSFPEKFTELLPAMRYLDAVRQQLFREKADGERFFEDFGYGFDEYILNRFVHEKVVPSDIKIINIHRYQDASISSFMDKLLRYLAWNGERSVAMRQLARDMHLPGVSSVMDLIKARQTDVKTFAQLETFLSHVLRPHIQVLSRLQIDARVLHLVASFQARQMDGVPESKVYLQSPYESSKTIPRLIQLVSSG